MHIESKPVQNTRLVAAIKAMRKNKTNESLALVADCVTTARFLVPAVAQKVESPLAADNKTIAKISFRMVNNSDGKIFIPVFTDWVELLTWRGDPRQNAAVLTFDEICDIVLDDSKNIEGFVLNIGSGPITFSKDNMSKLKKAIDNKTAESVNKQFMKQGTTIRFGDPKSYPEDLMQVLGNTLEKEPDIIKAYIRVAEIEENESWLLVLDFGGSPEEVLSYDPQELFGRIAAVARPHLHGKPLNMMPLCLPVAEKATEGKEPFYVAEIIDGSDA